MFYARQLTICLRLQYMQQHLSGKETHSGTSDRLQEPVDYFGACQSACSDYTIMVVYKCILAEYWICHLNPNRWLFTHFYCELAYVMKYAFSQALSHPNYALPGSLKILGPGP